MQATPVHVRLFASHPIAAAEYARILSAEKDLHIASEEGQFEVGIFDQDGERAHAEFMLARTRFPRMRAILLSPSCNANQCLHLLLRGFWGLVTYDHFSEELPQAVRQVAKGHLWFPASVVARWMRTNEVRQNSAHYPVLTKRECEIVGFLQRRCSNKEIAEMLSISERTVKFHVTNVFNKLGIGSRSELASNKVSGVAG